VGSLGCSTGCSAAQAGQQVPHSCTGDQSSRRHTAILQVATAGDAGGGSIMLRRWEHPPPGAVCMINQERGYARHAPGPHQHAEFTHESRLIHARSVRLMQTAHTSTIHHSASCQQQPGRHGNSNHQTTCDHIDGATSSLVLHPREGDSKWVQQVPTRAPDQQNAQQPAAHYPT
jgi:hypothetical protein